MITIRSSKGGPKMTLICMEVVFKTARNVQLGIISTSVSSWRA